MSWKSKYWEWRHLWGEQYNFWNVSFIMTKEKGAKFFSSSYHFVCVLKWNLSTFIVQRTTTRYVIKMQVWRLKWVQRTTLILSFYISEVTTYRTPLLNLITGCRNARHVYIRLVAQCEIQRQLHQHAHHPMCSSYNVIVPGREVRSVSLLSFSSIFSLSWVHVENSHRIHTTWRNWLCHLIAAGMRWNSGASSLYSLQLLLHT